MDVIDTTVDCGGIAEAIRKLADYVDAGDNVAVSVVCVMRHGDHLRLYAIGDDTGGAIREASVLIDGAIQTMMIDGERRH